jgi:hypothetical protein
LDPDLQGSGNFAGSGSEICGYGSGSGTRIEPFKKISNFKTMILKEH